MKFVNNGAAHWSIGVSASSATNNLNPFVITNTSDNGDVLWAGPFNPRFTFSTDGKFSIFTGTGGVTLKFRTGSSGLEIESPDGQDTRLFSNAVNTGIDTTGSAPYASTYGSGSRATGTASFAEGVGTLASGFAAHAAGFNTTASATASFSTGIETDADGIGSFTAGSGSWARGDASVAMGIGTIASTLGAAAPLILGAIGAASAAYFAYTAVKGAMDDGVIGPGGDRVLLGAPGGPIKFNKQDTIVAGTNLMNDGVVYGSKGSISLGGGDVREEIMALKEAIISLANRPINVTATANGKNIVELKGQFPNEDGLTSAQNAFQIS